MIADHSRNLELKIRCAPEDLVEIRQRLESLVCTPVQRLHQVDTYFRVERGRLKVRELRSESDPATVERAELIAYARPSDDAGSRWSSYQVIPVSAHVAADLLSGLLMTHEQMARVEKVRHVALLGQTRIHIDDVADLGAFVELETVISSQSDADATAEHQQVIAALQLDRFPAIAGSYSDLIHQASEVNGAG
jgi:predicted adenylyl cyclase CyaB